MPSLAVALGLTSASIPKHSTLHRERFWAGCWRGQGQERPEDVRPPLVLSCAGLLCTCGSCCSCRTAPWAGKLAHARGSDAAAVILLRDPQVGRCCSWARPVACMSAACVPNYVLRAAGVAQGAWGVGGFPGKVRLGCCGPRKAVTFGVPDCHKSGSSGELAFCECSDTPRSPAYPPPPRPSQHARLQTVDHCSRINSLPLSHPVGRKECRGWLAHHIHPLILQSWRGKQVLLG